MTSKSLSSFKDTPHKLRICHVDRRLNYSAIESLNCSSNADVYQSKFHCLDCLFNGALQVPAISHWHFIRINATISILHFKAQLFLLFSYECNMSLIFQLSELFYFSLLLSLILCHCICHHLYNWLNHKPTVPYLRKSQVTSWWNNFTIFAVVNYTILHRQCLWSRAYCF